MDDGMESKFVAEGEPHMDGEPGDLILKIATEPHHIDVQIEDGLQWQFSGIGFPNCCLYGVCTDRQIWIQYRHPYLFRFQLQNGVVHERTERKS